jgi:hypothetical protein
MTSEHREDSMCAVIVVVYRAHKSVSPLQLFVVTSYKDSINPIINPASSH